MSDHGYEDDSGKWIEVNPRYAIEPVGPMESFFVDKDGVEWSSSSGNATRQLYRTEWWRRALLWVDASINHPLILNGGWQDWLPDRVAQAIVWPFYRFCAWTVRWDEPLLPGDPRWDS